MEVRVSMLEELAEIILVEAKRRHAIDEVNVQQDRSSARRSYSIGSVRRATSPHAHFTSHRSLSRCAGARDCLLLDWKS